MFRRCTAIAALLIGFVFITASVRESRLDYESSGDMVRLSGHVLSALQRATPLAPGPRDDAQPLTVTIVLKRSDKKGFDRYLHDVYDPHSPRFRHFLTQTEISDRFGPAKKSYTALADYLKQNGLKVIQGSANRMTLTVRGTRAQTGRVFKVRIGEYRLGERTFYANDRNPSLPRNLASEVDAVAGLSNLAKPQVGVQSIAILLGIAVCLILVAVFIENPVAAIAILNTCRNALAALIVTGAANGIVSSGSANMIVSPGPANQRAHAIGSTVDGTGQTIGLLEFDTFNLVDVKDYLALTGLPAARIGQVSQVHVNGGAPAGPNQAEVLLDVDDVITAAPGAKIVVYDAPFSGPGTSFQALFNKMIGDGVNIISNSWAYCEDQTTASDVNSIDSLLATAAASGISVFNGTGDTGSTCLDGSPNTIAVPADSPHATAVGGSSLTPGPGQTYGSEAWWNGSSATVPTGQGGFGVSKFFPRPTYQNGLNVSPMRSIPDVVFNADPSEGVVICQASGGGCPTGLLNGGTSSAAPIWAALAALLNQAQGSNLGTFNPVLYPLAKTNAFHYASRLGSDFGHVGLGSPNPNILHVKLSGQTVGVPNALQSTLSAWTSPMVSTIPAQGVAADGASAVFVVGRLRDANGNSVSGKTVTLAATPGSHAKITPASAISTIDNGAAVFEVTDLTPEKLDFTATDTTDAVVLKQTAAVPFVTPPAAGAAIDAFPTSVPADGMSATTITLTLKDSLGRPTAGKLINLAQNGSSVITGPSPAVTDAKGQIQFAATDVKSENVTYTATDVTDGNLPFPNTPMVTFTSGTGCSGGSPVAASGFTVNSFATGSTARSFSFGGINFGCFGAYGAAFDPSGNLYVAEFPTGNVYKFGPSGGAAGAGTLITPAPLGPATTGIAFDKSGHLFASRAATTGDFTTGDVIQVNPSTGAIIREVSSGLICPFTVAADPISGDLFAGDGCTGNGSDSTAIWRISDPAGPSPKTTVYSNTPGQDNFQIAFAPNGTMYVVSRDFKVVRITGTSAPQPPAITTVPNPTSAVRGVRSRKIGHFFPKVATTFLHLEVGREGALEG
jgi:hypothetical protein